MVALRLAFAADVLMQLGGLKAMMTRTKGAVAAAALHLSCVLLLLSNPGHVAAQQLDASQPQFPTLWDAMKINNNTSTLFYWLNYGNVSPASAALLSQLKDPNAQLCVLNFNIDFLTCLRQFPWMDQVLTSTEALRQLLLIYVITGRTSLENLSTNTTTTLPTLMQQLPSVDPHQVLGNLTFVYAGQQMFYLGGIQPGGMVNISNFVTAGKGRMYTVDSCILPPNISISKPSMLGLTIADGLAQLPSVNIFHTLLMADEELSSYVSNPDSIMMVLAPDDIVFKQYLSDNFNTTVEAVKGSVAARALLTSHIVPGRPWNTGQLLQRNSWLFPSLDSSTNIAITSDGHLQIQAPGNLLPAVVESGNITIGKSIVHLISRVLVASTVAPSRPDTSAMTFRITVPVAADTSALPIVASFQQDVVEALAAWFSVLLGQVKCIVLPSTDTSTGRRSLQNFAGMDRQRRLLQFTNTLQVLAVVYASWASSDETIRTELQQQAALLQSHPDQLFPNSLVQKYGIAQQNVTATAVDSVQQLDLSPSMNSSVTQSAGAHNDSNVLTTAPPKPPSPVTSPSSTPLSPSPVQGSTPAASSPSQHPDTVPGAVQAPSTSPAASTPAVASSSGATLGKGGIIGIACGGSVLAIAVAAALLYVFRRHQTNQGSSSKQRRQDRLESATVKDTSTFGIVVEGAAGLQVLPPQTSQGAAPSVWEELVRSLKTGEVFLKATAQEYPWTTSASLSATCQAVEAGVNDAQLDNLVQDQQLVSAVQLTKAELTSQVQLLADGLLGRGGSALVFKCVWPQRFGPDALLAVKVLKDGAEASVTELQSFAYEAKLLSDIQHPHVVKLYGYCLEPPTVCLILELLPTSLKDMLYKSAQHVPQALAEVEHQNRGTQAGASSSASTAHHSSTTSGTAQVTPAPGQIGKQANIIEQDTIGLPPLAASAKALSLPQVVRISKQIASGLTYLHSRQLPAAEDEVSAHVRNGVKGGSIVHRDLKPANILLNSLGTAKITDFGLARRHEQTTIATVHVGAGTLAYMAPELLVAATLGTNHAVTNRVDIYSLGLMIWEMLAGEAPWHGLTATAILAAVINRRRPPLAGNDIDREHVTLEREGLTQPPSSLSCRPQEAGLSQLNNIIMSCWHHRELRRPAASAVLGMLSALEEQLEAQQQKRKQNQRD